MTKTLALKIVNPILAILLFNQVMTGLLNGMLSHEAYEVLHEGGGIAFAIVALLHVMLNFNWIKANFLRKPPNIRE